MRTILSLLALSVAISGCDVAKTNELEKQNTELKAKVERLQKKTAVVDLGTQEKCSKGAKEWFSENFVNDKGTILLTFTNHYNATDNHCYILVEKHYTTDKNGSWTNLMLLMTYMRMRNLECSAAILRFSLSPSITPRKRSQRAK